jgi:chemotaxis protein CheC
MNTAKNEAGFSPEDAAILAEVMNIAFGKASADLARVIDIRIVLSVPHVEIMQANGLLPRITEETGGYDAISVIEQNFWGKYKGSALLAFPSEAIRALVSLFDDEAPSAGPLSPLLEKDALLELGNILIGACVSKVAELLDDAVSFSPPRLIPRVTTDNISKETVASRLDNPQDSVVLMKTVFHFEDQDIKGFLFLIADQDSMNWLKTALNNFLTKF